MNYFCNCDADREAWYRLKTFNQLFHSEEVPPPHEAKYEMQERAGKLQSLFSLHFFFSLSQDDELIVWLS